MKVKLKKRARIWHEAGETVKVSPAEAAFLFSCFAAEKVEETKRKKK